MSVVDIKAPPEFDTLEVLAAAVSIFEYNNGYLKTAESFIDESGVEHLKWANREILRGHFLIDYWAGSPKPPVIEVTNDHLEKAIKIREYTRKELLNVIAGIQNYNTSLYEVINRETVIPNNLGFLASAPFYFKYSIEKDFYKEKIKNLQSNHVGSIGGKVFIDNFELVKINKSNNFPGWIIQGISEGNLFLFFTKHETYIKHNLGDVIRIQGNVRDHVYEQNTIPMTKLNRVYIRTEVNGNKTSTRPDGNSDMFRQRQKSDSGGDSLLPAIYAYCKSEP